MRAKRRFDELCAKGDAAETLESVEAKIMKRDEDDRNREISPLREAPDAVHLDTSDMNIDQAVEAVLSICREKGCIG